MSIHFSTPPFGSNDTHIMVAHMYARRQKYFVAAISGGMTGPDGPICLHANNLVTAAPVLGHPVLSELPPEAHTVNGPQPPKTAEFLLILCARSPTAAEACVGDMQELFRRDCAKRGPARAKLYYWGYTILSLWPLLKRAIGRAATWAAIISAVKRYFVG